MSPISRKTREVIAEKAAPMANDIAREELLAAVNPSIKGVLSQEWTPFRPYALVRETGLQLEPDKDVLVRRLMVDPEGYGALAEIAHGAFIEALSDEEVLTSLLKDAFGSDRAT